MRLDLFLKSSSFLKRRPIAKKLCDEGAVSVNGKPAKASREVKAGDVVEVEFRKKRVKVQVVEACEGTVGRRRNQNLGFILIGEEKKEQDFF